ncbi:hypothetical protein [Roseivirga pacifica]|uniref:hypothetical protein n=1 Tax=Roseivirga pacifica TaxID=1267423 RepID=UPI002094DD52|nr:hypothetical protein [Roseivirga pacifica]MCO6357232.1 hypothetical protein [Roseivirga pacifica]MCO6368054.1 hypothetical protein [Roseivirga pacifica]MCO6369464.1 hypothetical protein [Roseivirga pacifica]MCO6373318.1 hypothetical protein [Roseivirga pacifica]MCO6377425.1 hypothetical protein [Roseivirga pacifica]
MRKPLLISSLCFVLGFSLYAQDNHVISFASDSLKVSRGKSKAIIEIDINVQTIVGLDSCSLNVVQDLAKSDFPSSSFTVTPSTFKSDQLKAANGGVLKAFLTVKPDTLVDRDRSLVLKLITKSAKGEDLSEKNKGTISSLHITVKPFAKSEKLEGFNHLAYVGTNFDLAEGKIESKNLFFAANILKRPKTPDNKTGFYLSIYGNRAMTITDSSRIAERYDFQALTDSTYNRITINNEMLVERTSDNIGAYISPLFDLKLFHKSEKRANDFALYYAPSLEFVWRRTVEHISFGDPVRDTLLVNGTIPTNAQPVRPLRSSAQAYNEYMFNAGFVGLFMVLENKNLSVRVHGSVGYSNLYTAANSRSTNFDQQQDIFFTGRAWITEATTGITLQAEVNNTLNNPRPFFVATLSKAINFKDLSGIFKPITTRD